MNILSKNVISLLITFPKDDKEIGFNSGLISLLKLAYEGEGELEYNESIRKNLKLLKRSLTGFNLYSPDNLFDLDNFIIQKQKLSAVKLIKEVSGIGLREAKDISDDIFALYEE